jgi:hypothetical protein
VPGGRLRRYNGLARYHEMTAASNSASISTTLQIPNFLLLSTDTSRVSLPCTSEIQAGLQLLAVAPAQPKSGSIVDQHVEFTILVQLETANAIEFNDNRTVNSAKD